MASREVIRVNVTWEPRLMPKKVSKRVAVVGSNVHFIHPLLGKKECILNDPPRRRGNSSLKYIPPSTPVGKALLGSKAGDTVVAIAEDGTKHPIKIIQVGGRRAAA